MPNKANKSYVEELAFLDNKIAEMGGLAEHVLGLAFDALEQRDPVLAERVVELDRKIDALEHKNEGIDAALRGWQKRVRMAAARGEVAGLVALREKILASSKRLGLRPKRLQAFRTDDVVGI